MMSITLQRKRAVEIEAHGGQRRLTAEELAEYNNLAKASFHRKLHGKWGLQ
jgi:hypothetical protein